MTNPVTRARLERILKVVRIITVASLALSLVGTIPTLAIALFAQRRTANTFFNVAAPIQLGLFGLFLIALAIWLAILAIFYTRYSLRTLLLLVVSGAGCVTLIVALPNSTAEHIGILGLIALVMIVLFGIASFDPEQSKN